MWKLIEIWWLFLMTRWTSFYPLKSNSIGIWKSWISSTTSQGSVITVKKGWHNIIKTKETTKTHSITEGFAAVVRDCVAELRMSRVKITSNNYVLITVKAITKWLHRNVCFEVTGCYHKIRLERWDLTMTMFTEDLYALYLKRIPFVKRMATSPYPSIRHLCTEL